jgi:hypothetical protein|tara:strand:+ start:3295 stop:4179 length:885 start_codon:yes stop_codon:yes gene_type:complete
MSAQPNQKVDAGWDYTVSQVAVPHPVTGKKTGFFMNVRDDDNAVLGVTSSRYGLAQNEDVFGKADDALESRGIPYQRKIYVTENGAKARAIYDLQGDQFTAEVPEVGDVMGFRLIAQNSFDRTLRVSFALGLLRLICLNGMQTMEREVDMVKKHSAKINVGDLISDEAIDKALAKLQGTVDVYGSLAKVAVSQEEGLNVLQNLVKSNILSEKTREPIALIWNDPTHQEDKGRNLYNLNNAITQHMTHEVTGERFEYANRTTTNVLKRFKLAADNPNRLKKLVAVPATAAVVVSS